VAKRSWAALQTLIGAAATYIDASNMEDNRVVLPLANNNSAKLFRVGPQAASYLTHIGASMSLLQHIQHHLSIIHNAYEKKRSAIESLFSPVAFLPVELLCDIFTRLDDWKDVLAVSHVSRDWRVVAIGCSSLWSPGGGSREWVETCLQRSGKTRLLDICIRGSQHHLSTWPNPIIRHLLPSFPRWRNLEWRCSGDLGSSHPPALMPLLRWISEHSGAPLETLTITGTIEGCLWLPSNPIPVLPSVRNVSVCRVYPNRLARIVPNAQCVTLSKLELRIQDWRSLFKSLTCITKLTIKDVMTDRLTKVTRDQVILVPTLEELHVDGVGLGLVQFLLWNVDFPNLRKLSISQNEDPLLHGQLRSRLNQLEYLHIEGTPPSLKALLIRLLRPQNDHMPVLPCLRYLDIELDNAILDDQIGFEEQLMEFVASRTIEYERGHIESKLKGLEVTELTKGTVDWLELRVDGHVKVKAFIPVQELQCSNDTFAC